MAIHTASVTSTLTPLQSTGSRMPKVTSTLEHSQVILAKLPRVTTTLVHSQTIRSNITNEDIASRLVHSQTIEVEHVVSDPICSDSLEVTISIVLSKSSLKGVISNLAHQEYVASVRDNYQSRFIWP